jgi:hypothetical protein
LPFWLHAIRIDAEELASDETPEATEQLAIAVVAALAQLPTLHGKGREPACSLMSSRTGYPENHRRPRTDPGAIRADRCLER